jgi:hypothetical protein
MMAQGQVHPSACGDPPPPAAGMRAAVVLAQEFYGSPPESSGLWPGRHAAYSRRMDRPRVLLVEDHPGVAEQLRRVLEPEFEVVATVGDGRALLTAAD